MSVEIIKSDDRIMEMTDQKISLNDGHAMPRLGYGLWQIHDDQADALVSAAITAGFRHFDTAQAYNNEAGVGRGLRNTDVPREQLFVTSKLRGRDMGHDAALRSFDKSMKQLGLDALDLFLIHWPMPAHDRYVETWKALIELRASGRVRSIGVSNFTAAHIDRLVQETGEAPAVNQLELHPFFQQQDIRMHHERLGIVIEGYSPFGSSGAAVLRDGVVRSIAGRHGCTPAQVVLRWHLQQGVVPLPRTSKVARLTENHATWDFALDEADMVRMRSLDCPDGNTQPLPDDMNAFF
ncbi:aldo/keto reductase [Burkholderia aenigmatica]|uniref:aldo/keto reductase n=1 Tax=Burkholderia aenigmatica TaxID=2015348 RepID=UPI002651E2D6|nr:aldo/keto reductase [Burkholderia aenigmatica]MDN7874891.1 aldo/keto reductase [Burkholderia aenigmatica]